MTSSAGLSDIGDLPLPRASLGTGNNSWQKMVSDVYVMCKCRFAPSPDFDMQSFDSRTPAIRRLHEISKVENLRNTVHSHASTALRPICICSTWRKWPCHAAKLGPQLRYKHGLVLKPGLHPPPRRPRGPREKAWF